MSLNLTPSGERIHIGFFGVRNAGKSSVVNAVTGQDLSVVSDTLGTTTDPVRKAMELLPLGPVVIIDTPGIDDAGNLGELRVRKAREALRKCDIAVLVVDATLGLQEADRELVTLFEERKLPYVIAYNKADLLDEPNKKKFYEAGLYGGQTQAKTDTKAVTSKATGEANPKTTAEVEAEPAGSENIPADRHNVLISAVTGEGIHELKETLGHIADGIEPEKNLVSDLIDEGDLVVLVVPIDSSAPKGRIILPQQMVLRDVLDHHASALACQPDELAAVLDSLKQPPRLVITDSQAFGKVAAIVPDEVPLTSFSILMARYKGELAPFLHGVQALNALTDESRVLISEGCTHHRQCEDIGTVKIPAWIREFTGASPEFSFTSGGEFPDDLADFDLVIHCGGCTLNEKEMAYRLATVQKAGVPIVNYGMAIASMHGILERSLRVFETE